MILRVEVAPAIAATPALREQVSTVCFFAHGETSAAFHAPEPPPPARLPASAPNPQPSAPSNPQPPEPARPHSPGTALPPELPPSTTEHSGFADVPSAEPFPASPRRGLSPANPPAPRLLSALPAIRYRATGLRRPLVSQAHKPPCGRSSPLQSPSASQTKPEPHPPPAAQFRNPYVLARQSSQSPPESTYRSPSARPAAPSSPEMRSHSAPCLHRSAPSPTLLFHATSATAPANSSSPDLRRSRHFLQAPKSVPGPRSWQPPTPPASASDSTPPRPTQSSVHPAAPAPGCARHRRHKCPSPAQDGLPSPAIPLSAFSSPPTARTANPKPVQSPEISIQPCISATPSSEHSPPLPPS